MSLMVNGGGGGGGGVVPCFLKKCFQTNSPFEIYESLSFVTVWAKRLFCLETRMCQNTASASAVLLPSTPI